MALTVVGEPTGSDEVVRVAVELVETLAVPNVTPPMEKVSVPPLGLPGALHPVPLVQTTEVLRVTGVPYVALDTPLVTVVCVQHPEVQMVTRVPGRPWLLCGRCSTR